MALKNDGKDQKGRGWGERIREFVGITKPKPVKSAEHAVKVLKKRKGRP